MAEEVIDLSIDYSEEDTKRLLITKQLEKAGWTGTKVRMEVAIKAGRIIRDYKRQPAEFADYVLYFGSSMANLNAPMISIFVDRIEILSYGSLPPKQTVSGFFAGKSKPRCQELSDVFLQLRISERSGRGVTRVVDTYSKEAFDIESDFIKVTIPFSSERYLGVPSEQKSEQKSEQVYTGKASRVKEAIVSEMRNNASITTTQLMSILGLGKTIIQKYIRELTADGIIIHHGTKRGGYWEVLK